MRRVLSGGVAHEATHGLEVGGFVRHGVAAALGRPQRFAQRFHQAVLGLVQVAEVQRQQQSLADHETECRQKLESYEAKIEQANAQLEAAQRKLDELTTQCELTQRKVDAHEQNLGQQRDALKQRRQRLESIDRELHAQQVQRRELEVKLDAVKQRAHEQLELDGVILTKFDSDTRGGAALSVKTITGKPIRFIGTGEKLDALEEFHADRISNRILGMGDIVSLVERAQEQVSEEEAEALQAKMAKGQLTMDDFLKQLKTLRRMGSLKSLLGMMPGVGKQLKDLDLDDRQIDRTEAVIQSMTPDERRDVELLNNSPRAAAATSATCRSSCAASRWSARWGSRCRAWG